MLHGQSGSLGWFECSGVALLREQEETWRAVEWLVSAANGKLRGCPIGKAVALKVKAGEARDRGEFASYNTRFSSVYSPTSLTRIAS